MAHRALQVGDRFRLHADTCSTQDDAVRVWHVLRVTSGSATVRPEGRRPREVRGLDGEIKARFSVPFDSETISRHASVVLLARCEACGGTGNAPDRLAHIVVGLKPCAACNGAGNVCAASVVLLEAGA